MSGILETKFRKPPTPSIGGYSYMSTLQEEISRRRTFAIISHPDAGKTTLTEKFLLYGGAIAQAGAVKGKKTPVHATSDWMEIEKQRGISVTSLGDAVPVRRLLHQHSGYPRPPGLFRGYLPHPDGGRLAPSWSSTAPKAWNPRPASSSKCAPCATFPFSPLSTRWTGKPEIPWSCAKRWKRSWASTPTP